MKPIIGLTPLWDDDKDSIWMLPGYMDGIVRAGGTPVMFPLNADEAELVRLTGMCDGILLTGGHDVSPEIYHEEPLAGLVSACRMRDDMEKVILKEAIKTDKPLLGICRGIQFINAVLGGTLYQDLPGQRPSDIDHHQQPPYDRPVHRVSIVGDSPLYNLLKTEDLAVNSYHHQAVKDLAPSLESMALSEDGLVEALFMPHHRFLWAVQWHPEFSYMTDEASLQILEAFIDAAGD
ncbi:MAG: gamma-glutamyl-gamma-aminobutyrate hydrolase family protein [Eubacterium sp.]|nr:gamma-glutamyl-gamma-aminobutyrate hydrolase family protein [Eubacterium sp.]